MPHACVFVGWFIFNVVTVSSRLVHPADVPEAPNWRTVIRRQTIDLSSSTPRTIDDVEFNELTDVSSVGRRTRGVATKRRRGMVFC